MTDGQNMLHLYAIDHWKHVGKNKNTKTRLRHSASARLGDPPSFRDFTDSQDLANFLFAAVTGVGGLFRPFQFSCARNGVGELWCKFGGHRSWFAFGVQFQSGRGVA